MCAETPRDVTAGSHAQLTDAELVSRARRDDSSALDVLVRRHYRAAYAVALAILEHRADAEDVCHDAFVRASSRLAECRHPDRFVFWLFTIVRNQARNALDRRAVRRTAPLEHATAVSREDANRGVEIAELRSRLETAIRVLSPLQREVLLLHDLEGWDHEAIAEAIGTSAGMSRQHLFNARRRLREELGPDAPGAYLNA
jgi:RNA polymerase sigma factor (sigma-70 family)